MFESFNSYLWIITPALWAALITYSIWFFTRAKRYAPISRAEAWQLWTIHHKSGNCNSRKWRQLKHEGIVIGFECGCGYKHVQERPLVAQAPSTSVATKMPKLDTLRS